MKRLATVFILAISFLSACTPSKEKEAQQNKGELSFRVERAPEWTDVFKRTKGWFGGDGIYAIPYSGIETQSHDRSDSILFVFSDTVIGEITEGKLQPGYEMVNNSVAITAGNDPSSIRFKVASKANKSTSTFIPATPAAEEGDFYWLGDGFVNHALDSNLYLFAFRMRWTKDGSLFPFRTVGNALIVIDRGDPFPFVKQRQIDIPFVKQNPSKEDPETNPYGAAVLVNTTEAHAPNADGYIYVYGVHGKNKDLVVSRVKGDSLENFQTWTFWDGKAWSADPERATPLMDSVSNEMSVTALEDGRFAFIYQNSGIMPEIYLQVAESPVGPFYPQKEIWNTKNDIPEQDLITYNGKAHPAISKAGELLVSFTVNSFEFEKAIQKKPDLYRPRFVKIVFEKNDAGNF